MTMASDFDKVVGKQRAKISHGAKTCGNFFFFFTNIIASCGTGTNCTTLLRLQQWNLHQGTFLASINRWDWVLLQTA